MLREDLFKDLSSFGPKSLEEFFIQPHLVAPNSPLNLALKARRKFHAFFFGPPGCGKTTLAHLVARELGHPIVCMNAVDFKLENLRGHLARLEMPVIFIDEVHRLSRNQQEFLLPIMEHFKAIILGASTQNPSYVLTSAIRSRSFVFELKRLDIKDLEKILDPLLEGVKITPEARIYLLYSSNGDIRAMLNLLSLASLSGEITLEVLRALRPTSLSESANESNPHYNLASALIKSIRGSDVDASLYYLARLIHAGENPDFIARRLAILASEDIGNANPNALNLASSTLNIVQKIGYPEARIPLAQCVIYLASSPKSNAVYEAIDQALDYVSNNPDLPIPICLLPNSKSYLYPHDFGGYVNQGYLAKSLNFLKSKTIGFETTLSSWLQKIKGLSISKSLESASKKPQDPPSGFKSNEHQQEVSSKKIE